MDELDYRRRLEHLAARVVAGREELELALEARDELVVEAIEAGLSRRVVAQSAQIAPSRVHDILLRV